MVFRWIRISCSANCVLPSTLKWDTANKNLALAKSWIQLFFLTEEIVTNNVEFIQSIIQNAVVLRWCCQACEQNWPGHYRWECDELVAVAPGGGESRQVAALQACPNRRIHGQSTHTAPDSSLVTHASMQTQSAAGSWIQPLAVSSTGWLLMRCLQLH